ncbi:MAG: hypothetical protein WBJ13_10960, partial [Sedimentibacter sp.]
ALDVVHRRLTAAGLNDFCLVLHSHKANKKAVLEQLETVLNLAKNKAELSDDAYLKLDTLERDREKLNQYANQLFEKVEPLGKSIYEVNGIVANLNEYKDVVFLLENIKDTDFKQYSRYIYVLTEFVNSIGKMSEDYDANPWRGANVESVTNELRHDIGAKVPKLITKLEIYHSAFQKTLSDVSLVLPLSYANMQKAKEIFKIAKNSPIVPTHWIFGEEISPLFDEVAECEKLKNSFYTTQTILAKQYDDLSALNNDLLLSNINGLQEYVFIQKEKDSLQSFIESSDIYNRIEKLDNYDSFIEEKNQAEQKAKLICAIQTELLNSSEKEIFDIDYNAILARYRTVY